MPGHAGSPSRIELELLREMAMDRMGEAMQKRAYDIRMKEQLEQSGEARQKRVFDIRMKEHMDRSKDILIEDHMSAAPEAIYRTYRNRAEAFSGVQPAPAPKVRRPAAGGKAPVTAEAEVLREQHIMERELMELAGSLKGEQVELVRKAGVLAALQASEPVKVNRVRTKQGYILRIETGKESIDIRIGENDIIVENRQHPE